MGKATITIVDEPKDEVRFHADFDPELKDDSVASPAQAIAIAMLSKVNLNGLEKTLAPFVSNPKEEPQPQEKIND